jgi:hypothetical protein
VGCWLCWLQSLSAIATICNLHGLGSLLWLQSCLRWLALPSGSKFGLPTGPPAGQPCVSALFLRESVSRRASGAAHIQHGRSIQLEDDQKGD